jgi:hypothetical protein
MFSIGNGSGGWIRGREYPFNKQQWIAIFGGCEKCEENSCSQTHEFGWKDVERATGWSLQKQARWLGVDIWELNEGARPARSSGTQQKRRPQNRDALRNSYKRETQVKSADGHVHYGLLKKLKNAGYELPEGFDGNSHAFAEAIGVSHAELATIFKMTERDLRSRGTYTLSE